MDLSYDNLCEKYFETLLPFPQILLDLPRTVHPESWKGSISLQPISFIIRIEASLPLLRLSSQIYFPQLQYPPFKYVFSCWSCCSLKEAGW